MNKQQQPKAHLKISQQFIVFSLAVLLSACQTTVKTASPTQSQNIASTSNVTATDINGQVMQTEIQEEDKHILSGNEAESILKKNALERSQEQEDNGQASMNNAKTKAALRAQAATNGRGAKNGDSLADYTREQQVKLDEFFGPLPLINQLQIIRHYKARGIYVANAKNIRDIINLVKNSELNAVVINVKSDSYFHYPTSNKIARRAGLSIEDSDDLANNIKQFKAAGIRVIGKISCFRDTLLARNYPSFAVKDRNNRVINWAAEGEASFVNPYNMNVWRYLRDCCYEAIDLGCDELVLDQVRFPTGYAANEVGNVYYGEPDVLPDKIATLSRFLEFMRVEISDKLAVPLTASLFDIHSEKSEASTGQSYKTFTTCGIDSISPNLFPADYANASPWYGNGVGTEINGELFKAPDLEPYRVIAATSNYYLYNYGKNKLRTFYRPYLQAFTAYYLPAKYWHEYTPLEIAKQIKALQDNGISEYILWNSDAHYDPAIFSELASIQNDKLSSATEANASQAAK